MFIRVPKLGAPIGERPIRYRQPSDEVLELRVQLLASLEIQAFISAMPVLEVVRTERDVRKRRLVEARLTSSDEVVYGVALVMEHDCEQAVLGVGLELVLLAALVEEDAQGTQHI